MTTIMKQKESKKGKTHNQLNLKIRQNRIFKLMARGSTQEDIIETLNKEGFKTSRTTVQRDAKIIREEIVNKMRTGEHSTIMILGGFIGRHAESYREAWRLYSATPFDKVKARCLELIHKMNHDYMRILQSIGMIPQKPIEFIGEIKEEKVYTVKKVLEVIGKYEKEREDKSK